MSNSERHQERRRDRAKQKEKENNMIRNAHHGRRFSRGLPKFKMPKVDIKIPSRWQRFLNWLKRIFRWRSING